MGLQAGGGGFESRTLHKDLQIAHIVVFTDVNADSTRRPRLALIPAKPACSRKFPVAGAPALARRRSTRCRARTVPFAGIFVLPGNRRSRHPAHMPHECRREAQSPTAPDDSTEEIAAWPGAAVAGTWPSPSHIMTPMRSDLPTGTVTFLFTDVEGSTGLLRELVPRPTRRCPHRRVRNRRWQGGRRRGRCRRSCRRARGTRGGPGDKHCQGSCRRLRPDVRATRR
jgi:hypothetical protein